MSGIVFDGADGALIVGAAGVGTNGFEMEATSVGAGDCVVRDEGAMMLRYGSLLDIDCRDIDANGALRSWFECEAALAVSLVIGDAVVKGNVWAWSRSLAEGDGRDTVWPTLGNRTGDLLVGAGNLVASSSLFSSEEVIARNGREIQLVNEFELSSRERLSDDGLPLCAIDAVLFTPLGVGLGTWLATLDDADAALGCGDTCCRA